MELLPYEIHITVQTEDIDLFKRRCIELDVKPIVIDMLKKDGNHLFDVMTSKTEECESFSKAWLKMSEQVSKLSRDFKVVRNKIETVPWHQDAPSINNEKQLNDGRHFETHFGVIIHNKTEFQQLKEIAEKYNLHLSANVFKRYDDGSYCQMVTYRSYSMLADEFQEYSNLIESYILEKGLTFKKKPRVEFAIWDSNKNHDLVWLS